MKKVSKNSLAAEVLQPKNPLTAPRMLQEELCLAKEKVENVAKLYTDLYVEIYNFSPAGYFQLDPSGKFHDRHGQLNERQPGTLYLIRLFKGGISIKNMDGNRSS